MKEEHLRTQELIAKSLVGCKTEVSLPALRRRADLLWEPEKVVFEVQCSPITPQEVLTRMSDYASAGYRVIWVLHDALYNKHLMTPAEKAMISKAHLFSELDPQGRGAIYAQPALTLGLKRIKRSQKRVYFGKLKSSPLTWLDALLSRCFPE